MNLGSQRAKNREDIVSASLSEIVLFFLFFCLILLGSLLEASGFKNSEDAFDTKLISQEEAESLRITIMQQVRWISELEGAIGSQSDEIDRLTALIVIIRGENSDLKSENQTLSDQVAALGEQMGLTEGELAAEREARQLDNEEADQREQEAKETKSSLNARIGELERALKLALAKLGDAEAKADRDALLIVQLQRERDASKREADRLRIELAELKGQFQKKTDLPVSVTLDESQGYTFSTSSADISQGFEQTFRFGNDSQGERSGLLQVIELLQQNQSANIAAIEVIGHTDEVPFGRGGRSNLDTHLVGRLQNEQVGRLSSADNVGLGMARAVETSLFLRRVLQENADKLPTKYRSLPTLPLSAGQLQRTDGSLTEGGRLNRLGNQLRRRIEIRLRSAGRPS